MKKPESAPEIYDLSLLTFFAAKEIERLRKNRTATCTYAHLLPERLKEELPDNLEDIYALPPGDIRVLRTAVSDANNGNPITDTDLPSQLNEILRKLNSTKDRTKNSQLTDHDLDRILEFLVSFHGQLLAKSAPLKAPIRRFQ